MSAVCYGEAYTSISRLKEVLAAEKTWYKLYHEYLEKEQQRVAWLESLLEETHEVSKSLYSHERMDDARALDFLSHPTQVFRYINSWTMFQDNLLNKENVKAFAMSIMDQVAPSILQEDRGGAATALLRLQHIYNLSTPALINGMVAGEAGVSLRPEDVYHIGLSAFNNGDLDKAYDWLQHVVTMSHNNNLHVPVSNALCTMARIQFRKGNSDAAMGHLHRASEIDVHNTTLQTAIQKLIKEESSGRSWGDQKEPRMHYLDQQTWENYEKLCRQDSQNVRNRRLLCRYRIIFGPYHFFKEEILSHSPRITLIYDVVTSQEANYIINTAKPMLQRAWVLNMEKGMTDKGRVSQMTWLKDKHSNIMRRLDSKISHITGLNATTGKRLLTSELYQVVNYGIGGHYEPHVDAFGEYLPKHEKKKQRNTGDRLATFLIYLSDVRAGGATVFPDINVHVPPVKYAAAFWYNLKRSEEIDVRTLHAGCPVLLGEKWVANKWFRERGQELNYPCGNLPQDIYDTNIVR